MNAPIGTNDVGRFVMCTFIERCFRDSMRKARTTWASEGDGGAVSASGQAGEMLDKRLAKAMAPRVSGYTPPSKTGFGA